MSEYEGLDNLIEQWVDEEFQLDGQSMLAGACTPPNEREALVFHMTTWAATAKVLSPIYQTAFRTTFAKYNILPPQMLHKVNTDAIYRVSTNLRDDFAKGADSMNKNLQNLTRRLDDMEQRNQQQHQATQLQLTTVTSSLNTMTQAITGLEDRVVKTQRAILAQSQEIGLTRNVTDTSVNILTLEMNIMLERDPEKKKALQTMLDTMQAKKKTLQATIEKASNDFMAIVSHPIAQLTQATTTPDANTVTPIPAPISPTTPPGLSQQAPPTVSARRRAPGTSNTAIGDHESSASKRRRVETEFIASSQEDIVPAVCHNNSIDKNKLIVAHDGISVAVMNAKPVRQRIQCLFHGVLDKLRDLSSCRHSYTSPCRSPKTPGNTKLCFVLGIIVIALSLLPIVNAATPLASTSTFSIYALNANGLVQPVKLNHINKVINTLKPYAFVIGETKTQSKLSKSLPFLDYDIYEESGERADNHHIFKWGIVMGIRKDIQIVQ
jgi:hypothetical protein